MQCEIIIIALILISYGLMTTVALIGISRILSRQIMLAPVKQPSFFSIVVSCRNEEKNIKNFIAQLDTQNYPKSLFELILIDDASEDATYELAKKLLETSHIQHILISNKEHIGKKKNLEQAIRNAKGNIIITTDADVILRHSHWLSKIASYFEQSEPDMLIMPVDYTTNNSVLSAFQIIENIALTGITAGFSGVALPFLCNGANLAFTKKAFIGSGGYSSHLHLSSGEDVFLMESIKKQLSGKILYGLSKDLIVKMPLQNNLGSFIKQRVRWASKTSYNKNPVNFLSALIILLTNLIFPFWMASLFIDYNLFYLLGIFAFLKCFFDFLLLFLAGTFLGRNKYLFWLIPFECIYWLYAFIIGISSIFWKPEWKGKKIN